MRWILLMFASLGGTVILITMLIWYLTLPVDLVDDTRQGDPARGQTLAHIGGCIACHTDVKGGGAMLAGGLPLKTDFGSFIPPNITPDFDHGIGHWTLDDFSKALRLGQSPDGRPYYPAFPYDAYTKLSDQDIIDLFEWFRTVPPSAEPRTGHDLSLPFNIREGLWVWQALYLDHGRYQPDPTRSEAWNRGAYLVLGLGHCGACHTPRDLLGGPQSDQLFAGAKGLPGNQSAPAITAAALKRAGFDHDALTFALDIGMLPDGDFFGGSMTEVIDLGTSKISAADRAAIATFLLDSDALDP